MPVSQREVQPLVQRRDASVVVELAFVASFALPNGPGAQLRGTGASEARSKHSTFIPNSTTGRLERAVPRQLQRLVRRHPGQ